MVKFPTVFFPSPLLWILALISFSGYILPSRIWGLWNSGHMLLINQYTEFQCEKSTPSFHISIWVIANQASCSGGKGEGHLGVDHNLIHYLYITKKRLPTHPQFYLKWRLNQTLPLPIPALSEAIQRDKPCWEVQRESCVALTIKSASALKMTLVPNPLKTFHGWTIICSLWVQVANPFSSSNFKGNL